MADEYVYVAGRSMTAKELLDVIEVMREWLRELDKGAKYSQPNGHLWNAIDEAQAKNRG